MCLRPVANRCGSQALPPVSAPNDLGAKQHCAVPRGVAPHQFVSPYPATDLSVEVTSEWVCRESPTQSGCVHDAVHHYPHEWQMNAFQPAPRREMIFVVFPYLARGEKVVDWGYEKAHQCR